MQELRMMMLTTDAAEKGLQPNETYPKVFGVVMDLPISGGHSATVVSMWDGHSSLYTTTGGGVLGGIAHESVRTASMDFVKVAQAHHGGATPTATYPYPSRDHALFYLLGFDGVRVVDAEIAALEKGADSHADLWMAGQRVLNELRLMAQRLPKTP